jgi:hypothetical protein
MPVTDDIRRVARERFGWARLRAEQVEAMEHVLAGHDVLAVLPTGAGKSAIYQVPAVLLDGPTLVVSPLIALQQDQIDGIDGIEDSRAPDAVALNSAQTAAERRDAWETRAGHRSRRSRRRWRPRKAATGSSAHGWTCCAATPRPPPAAASTCSATSANSSTTRAATATPVLPAPPNPGPRHGRVPPRQRRPPHRLGRGVVISVEPDRMTVLFDNEGYQTLSPDAVRDNNLLTAEDHE